MCIYIYIYVYTYIHDYINQDLGLRPERADPREELAEGLGEVPLGLGRLGKCTSKGI